MIVLDTNVISEMMKFHGRRSMAVDAWIGRHHSQELFTTAISAAEILTGLAMLPPGRRRDETSVSAEAVLELFSGRVLPFDERAARRLPEVVAGRRARGRPISGPDAQIIAIALANGMAVATRNVSDFADSGIDVLDPWEVA